MFTPETSRHFTAHVDPVTHMTFYVLSTRVAPLQQNFYFVNAPCEPSRRYLWFYCAFPPAPGKCAGVLDFASDEVRFFPDTYTQSAESCLVDECTGNLYWGSSLGIFMRTPHPQDKAVRIARMPEDAAAHLGSSMATHLTFSPDRKELGVDIQTPNGTYGSYIGTVNLETGTFTQWYRTENGVPYNHAQFCPSDGDTILAAHEGSINISLGKRMSPALTAEGIYPRLQLIHRDGSKEMRRPLNNYATHEWWAADGQSIYYCSKNHIVHDRLGSHEPEAVCYIPIEGGNGTWHAHCTRDERYFIVDGSRQSMGLSWWRGCASTVRFWNNDTKKLCELVHRHPVVENWTPEDPCPYHIDPHPRFVWGDEWVSFTTTVAGRVDIALAPVQQLIDATR